MRPPRPPRDPQRGNSLLLALIVMSALATLGSLTVVSMQSSIQMSTNDRFQAIAMYAAESGAAVAMDFLRKKFDAVSRPGWTTWSTYVVSNNDGVQPVSQTDIPSNDALPGTPNNLLDSDQSAWYDIQLYNNRDDPSFGTGTGTNDTDGILIIRSTGHGPQGSVAIIEWEVQRVGFWGALPAGTQPTDLVPPPLPPTPLTLPPVAPTFWLYAQAAPPNSAIPYPPSFPWAAWAPAPPPPNSTTGLVLLGWHIVSL